MAVPPEAPAKPARHGDGAVGARLAPLLAFWQALRDDPRRVGALAPSGPALAQAMLAQTLAEPPGHVIEIGAGTGAITAALVAHADRFESLHVVERDARLADGLRRRFPSTPVHAACASQLDGLHHGPVERLTLVSSIPFGSLPAADHALLLAAIARQTAKSARWRLLQYSYGGRLPFVPATPGQRWTRLATVWRNLPPATVWQLATSPEAVQSADTPAAPGGAAIWPS